MSRIFAHVVSCLFLAVCGCATVTPDGGDFRELVAAGDPLALRQQHSVRELVDELQREPLQYRNHAAEQLIQEVLDVLYGAPANAVGTGSVNGPRADTSVANSSSLLAADDAKFNANRFRVLIIRDSAENAHALPDGTLVLHLGLLAALESVEQLAFVLAHEGEHVLANHAYNSARHQRTQMQRHWLAAMVPGRRDTVSRDYFARLGLFSRQQERQADTAALKRLLQRDVDAVAAVEFFNVLQRYPVRMTTGSKTRSHPGHRQRLLRLRVQIQNLMAGVSDPDLATDATSAAAVAARSPALDAVRGRWQSIRAVLLADSIGQKLVADDLAGALVQIDALETMQSTSATSECLRGRLYAALAANPVQARQALQAQRQHSPETTLSDAAHDAVPLAAALPGDLSASGRGTQSIDPVALFRRHGEAAFDNAARLVRNQSDQLCVSRGREELRTGISVENSASLDTARMPALQFTASHARASMSAAGYLTR